MRFMTSSLTGVVQEDKVKSSYLGMPHKLPGRRPEKAQPLAGNSYAPNQQVVAPSYAERDDGECLKSQPVVLNPDVAPFVPRGSIVTRDGVDPSTTVMVKSGLNSSFVTFENWSISGINKLVDSEAPRIAPISTQGKSFHVSEFIERKTVTFLFDTGAEVTAIGRGVLGTLPKILKTTFQDRSNTLKMTNGESIME